MPQQRKITLYTTFKNEQYLERSISHCIEVESIYLGFEDMHLCPCYKG